MQNVRQAALEHGTLKEMDRYSCRMGRESGRECRSWGWHVVMNVTAGAVHGGTRDLARERIL
eukprot:2149876-Ditylum_brightwellii.AAC.1